MDTTAARRAPSATELRLFTALPFVYALLVLAVLPIAGHPGIHNASIAAVAGFTVAFADLCTSFLLGSEYRRSGRTALVYLSAAYLYSGIMAILHVLTFPGAIVDGPLIGNAQTVGWLFPLWRMGTAILMLLGLKSADVSSAVASDATRPRTLALVSLAIVLTCGALGAVFCFADGANMSGDAFGTFNLSMSWATVVLLLAGVVLIWRRRAFDDALYLWLALVLIAWAADMTLSNAAGARYTVGWYVSRASWVISNCVLLMLWLTHESSEDMPPERRLVAEYGSALCILMAALLLEWFLLPWLGTSYPFATAFSAIAMAVWIGGWRAALCIAAVGYVVVNTWFLPADVAFSTSTVSGLLALFLYCMTSSIIIGLGEAMRRARDRHRAAEQRLTRSTIELQRADANKSKFLAVLSHELRNPMAPLRNALALLATNTDRQTIARLTPIMERQLAHLARLIDDLLDVSRIDRGKLEVKRERIAMESVVKGAIETAKPNIESKSHELVLRFPADPIYVLGDPVRLTQVLANVLNNAAKFTPARGHIELSLKSDGEEALVEVTDNGVGIERGELDRIFDMFVQLDASRAVAAGGLGLGLSLARSIMQLHGGALEAYSDGAEKGSRFVMRLPAVPRPPQEQPLHIVPAAAASRNRVLVVDDNQDAATTLAALLRLEGHDVRVAFDGLSALGEAQTFEPHVAFIDLNMPGLDGLELGRKLREDPRTRTTKLIAITGMGQQSDIARTHAAGFDAHLNKPASVEEIRKLAA